MFSGVSIVCFASSYAIAWALELYRLLFHRGARGLATLGFAGAGLVAHTAFLYYRAVHQIGAPLSSERDWYLVAAWVLVLVYLFLAVLHPKVPFGLFLLPLAMAMIGAAKFLASAEPLAREPASKVWGAVHGISIMLAAVSVLVGFAAGLMYFGQVRHLKAKRPLAGGIRLPSLEWLQWANSRAIYASVLMLGIGVLAGMVLNRIHRDDGMSRLPWNDPVVLSTWLMFAWLLVAVVINAFYRPVRQGHKVAYLTVASFLFLVIVLAIGLLAGSRHWERGEVRGQGAGVRDQGAEQVASGQKLVASGQWSVVSSEGLGFRGQDTEAVNYKSEIRNQKSLASSPQPLVSHSNPEIPKSPIPNLQSPIPVSIVGGEPC